MLLSTAATAAHSAAQSEALMGRVLTIFAIFWVVVLFILFVAIGQLLKKHDQLSHSSHH